MAALRRRRVDGARTRTLKIRFSEAEWQELEAMASDRAVSVTRLLVDASLTSDGHVGGVRPAPGAGPGIDPRVFELGHALDRIRPEIAQAGAQMVRVGNNINQVAHVANTAGQVDDVEVLHHAAEDLGGTLEELRAVLRELREWLIRFPSHGQVSG